MTTKPLLLAVMLALPITANAAYTYVDTPVGVGSDETARIASFGGPYQIITPGADDDKHIASTKYVIGAYNDAITAVNRQVTGKQGKLYLDVESGIIYLDDEVLSSNPVLHAIAGEEDYEINENSLVSGAAVVAGIQSQRVEVYTNWDDDDATTDVAFKTVVPED